MPKGKSDLEWTNISAVDLSDSDRQVFDAFIAAKAQLEAVLGQAAIDTGAAQDGDEFKFSYSRIGQGTVGMAIAAPASKAQASGFGGLKKPKPTQNLAEWARDRDASGYRR